MSSCIKDAFSGRLGAFYDFIYPPARRFLFGRGGLHTESARMLLGDDDCAAVRRSPRFYMSVFAFNVKPLNIKTLLIPFVICAETCGPESSDTFSMSSAYSLPWHISPYHPAGDIVCDALTPCPSMTRPSIHTCEHFLHSILRISHSYHQNSPKYTVAPLHLNQILNVSISNKMPRFLSLLSIQMEGSGFIHSQWKSKPSFRLVEPLSRASATIQTSVINKTSATIAAIENLLDKTP